MKRFFFIIICLLGLASCQQSRIYDDAVVIPQETWIQNMPACFDVLISDTTCFCNMFLNIRNTTQYEFSNLYLFVTMVLPDGRMARDTINCQLADKDGRWLGKGMGSVKELHLPFRSDMVFPVSGTYRFYIEQAMRIDSLVGVNSIGIQLEKEKI